MVRGPQAVHASASRDVARSAQRTPSAVANPPPGHAQSGALPERHAGHQCTLRKRAVSAVSVIASVISTHPVNAPCHTPCHCHSRSPLQPRADTTPLPHITAHVDSQPRARPTTRDRACQNAPTARTPRASRGAGCPPSQTRAAQRHTQALPTPAPAAASMSTPPEPRQSLHAPRVRARSTCRARAHPSSSRGPALAPRRGDARMACWVADARTGTSCDLGSCAHP